MKKCKLILFLISLLLISYGCSEDSTDLIIENQDTSSKMMILDSAYDGYFEWDKINEISTLRPNNSDTITIPLPWEYGSSVNIGIPKPWLDVNAQHPVTSERLYSRENGWELVYSNLHRSVNTKYFALYNKYTGLLRFFFYEVSDQTGYGTTISFWGIGTDNYTSLFDFSNSISKGINNRTYQPAQITTPTGTLSGSNYSSIGYKENNWYGLELLCAYDTEINSENIQNFYIKGWAANQISLSGTTSTTGQIEGTIKTNLPNSSGLNLSLSNMFNNSSKSEIIGDSNSLVNWGNTIDEKIAGNDSFFTGLWNNVKNNASRWITSGLESGAKKGIETILSSGGSAIGNALGGLVNSIVGGGQKEIISKVDLSLSTVGTIELQGEVFLTGWGGISALPIPGSKILNEDLAPLYNKPLGVWALGRPINLILDSYITKTWLPVNYYWQHCYRLETTPYILLNPEIKEQFSIEHLDYSLVVSDTYYNQMGFDGIPAAVFNGTKFYELGIFMDSILFTDALSQTPVSRERILNLIYAKENSNKVYLKVSFDLVDKNDPTHQYSFSNHFEVNLTAGDEYYREEVYPTPMTRVDP